MAEMGFDISVDESCLRIDVPTVIYGTELLPETQVSHGYDYTYEADDEPEGRAEGRGREPEPERTER